MRRSLLPLILTVLCLRLPAPLGAAAASSPTAGPPADAGERDPADFPRPAGLVRQSFEHQQGVQRTTETATYHTGSGLDEIAGRYADALDAAGWKRGQHSDTGTGLHRVVIVDWDRPAREAEIRFYGAKEGADLWVRVFTYPARAGVAAQTAGTVPPTASALVRVPDVAGKPVGWATGTLYDAQLAVVQGPARTTHDLRRDATVAEQDPPAGRMVGRGSTVTIVPWAAVVQVPHLVGRQLAQAKSALAQAGAGPTAAPPGTPRLVMAIGPAQPTPDRAKDNTVAAQNPATGTDVPLHATVTVTPWAALVAVPNVVGKSVMEAKTTLTQGGPRGGPANGQFTVEVGPAVATTDMHKDGLVAEQHPAAEEQAPMRSVVTINPWASQAHVPNMVGRNLGDARRMLTQGGPAGHDPRFVVEVGTALPTTDPRQDGEVAQQNPAAGAQALQHSTVTLIPWVQTVPVPNLVGKTVATAQAELKQSGAATGPRPGGGFTSEVAAGKPTPDRGKDLTVAEQIPAAGEPAPRGSKVTLVPWAALYRVPNLVGTKRGLHDWIPAQGDAANAGSVLFLLKNGETRPTADPAKDHVVIAQDPAAGTQAPRGTIIVVTVYALQAP